MFERMCSTPAIVVGLHTAIEILSRTYIEAVVGAVKDIRVVHGLYHSTRFLVLSGSSVACLRPAEGP
jgi:hypothetical protein